MRQNAAFVPELGDAGAGAAGAAAGRADPRPRLRRRRADRADRRRPGAQCDRPRRLAGDGRGGAGARDRRLRRPTPRRWTSQRFGQFDAVFSNAALHWMLDPDAVATGIFAALKHGGRFVGEMGGEGNLATLRQALRDELTGRGYHDAGAGPGLVCGRRGVHPALSHRRLRPGPGAELIDAADAAAGRDRRLGEDVPRRPDGRGDGARMGARRHRRRGRGAAAAGAAPGRRQLVRRLCAAPLLDAEAGIRSGDTNALSAAFRRRPARDARRDRRQLDRRSVRRRARGGAARRARSHGLPDHASELGGRAAAGRRWRGSNMVAGDVPFFLGCGAYRHHIPASVDHLIQRGEFLTSYTPYQPEIAQGTLQALFEFQTQVARLYGCEVANASMYDGSTACWEAIAMARRITRRGKAILSGGLHPALCLGGEDDGEVHRRRARRRGAEAGRRSRTLPSCSTDRRRDQLRRRPISRHPRPDRRPVRAGGHVPGERARC